MEPLTPVPTPFAAYWREFRTRAIPALAFAAAAGGAGWLWLQQGSATAFPGLAEGVRSVVTSAQPGTLHRLLVQPYQIVEAGTPVAVILPTDPRGKLDLWQSELEMTRLRLQPSIAEENAVSFERLRLELLRMQSEVAATEVELQLAENQVRRQTALYEQQLVSDDLYELTVKTRDSLRAELAAKSNAVDQIQQRLAVLRPMGEPPAEGQPGNSADFLDGLAARQMAIATNWGPMPLLAPVAGMVTGIHRQAGENVVDGEPVLTISSLQSDRVIGYIRQPFPDLPEPGMAAVLTTRAWKRSRYLGTVSQIGAQLEYITNSLAIIRAGTIVDFGLPVVISLPPDASIRPGEIVDVEIRPRLSANIDFKAGSRPRPVGQQL